MSTNSPERRGIGPWAAGGILALNGIAIGLGIVNHDAKSVDTAKDGRVTTVSDGAFMHAEVTQTADGKVESLTSRPSDIALEVMGVLLADGAIAVDALRKRK